ncbi:MAG: hypothetical protein R2827_13175 [Bdellovibrionales bacterium]
MAVFLSVSPAQSQVSANFAFGGSFGASGFGGGGMGMDLGMQSHLLSMQAQAMCPPVPLRCWNNYTPFPSGSNFLQLGMGLGSFFGMADNWRYPSPGSGSQQQLYGRYFGGSYSGGGSSSYSISGNSRRGDRLSRSVTLSGSVSGSASASAYSSARARSSSRSGSSSSARAGSSSRSASRASSDARASARSGSRASSDSTADASARAQARSEAIARQSRPEDRDDRVIPPGTVNRDGRTSRSERAGSNANSNGRSEAQAQSRANSDAQSRAQSDSQSAASARGQSRAEGRARSSQPDDTDNRQIPPGSVDPDEAQPNRSGGGESSPSDSENSANGRSDSNANSSAQAQARAEAEARAAAEARARNEAEARGGTRRNQGSDDRDNRRIEGGDVGRDGRIIGDNDQIPLPPQESHRPLLHLWKCRIQPQKPVTWILFFALMAIAHQTPLLGHAYQLKTLLML